MATASTKADVYYPESDGEPMGETLQHRDANIDLILNLQDWFADDPLAYVSGDEFVYWIEGQPRYVVSPDVWCCRGIDKTIVRNIYKTWLEGGKGPEFVIELTSPSTRRVDRGKKFRIYQDDLKVFEYVLFDPLGEYLKPVLQGYRLVEGEYRPIEAIDGRLPSEFLGLHLEPEGHLLRLYNPATGRRLLNRLERLDESESARRESDENLKRTRTRLRRKDATIQEKDATIQEKDAALHESRAEIERLRRELEAIRAGQKPKKRK